MRTEPKLHEAVRDLYTAITLTFSNTGAYKIVENSNNEAQIGLLQIAQQQVPQQLAPQQQAPQPSLNIPPQQNGQHPTPHTVRSTRKKKR